MFIAVFNWMLAHVPGVLRPAVDWLLGGLRKITGYISARWNALGRTAGTLYRAVTGLREQLSRFAITTALLGLWLRDVWIPRQLTNITHGITAWVGDRLRELRAELMAWLNSVITWVQYGLDLVGRTIAAITVWAMDELGKLNGMLHALLDALAPILGGPDALADWLLGALLNAAARYAYASRDRIINWLLRGSLPFTRWLATTLEDILMRIL